MSLIDVLMQMGNMYGVPDYGQEGPPQTMPNGLMAYPGAPMGMAQLPPQQPPVLAGTNPFSAPAAIGMDLAENSTMMPQMINDPVQAQTMPMPGDSTVLHGGTPMGGGPLDLSHLGPQRTSPLFRASRVRTPAT